MYSTFLSQLYVAKNALHNSFFTLFLYLTLYTNHSSHFNYLVTLYSNILDVPFSETYIFLTYITVDLVTLDDLSSEAMLESSQRVEMLADTFRRKQEALSDPGPPCPLPPRIRKSNPCITLLALWM